MSFTAISNSRPNLSNDKQVQYGSNRLRKLMQFLSIYFRCFQSGVLDSVVINRGFDKPQTPNKIIF